MTKSAPDRRFPLRRWMVVLLALTIWLVGISGMLLIHSAHGDAPSPPSPSHVPTDLERALQVYLTRHRPAWFTRTMTEYITLAWPPSEDTFVARNYPYNYQDFHRAEVLVVGNEGKLGDTRIYLRFRPETSSYSPPPGSRLVGLVFAFGVAGEKVAEPLPVTLSAVSREWYGGLTWETQPSATPLLQGELGTAGHWSFIDIPVDKRNMVMNMRLEAPNVHHWKASWSREKNKHWAPHLIFVYLPDMNPPTCEVDPLPSVIYETPIKVEGQGRDEEDNLHVVRLLYRVDDGPWQEVWSSPALTYARTQYPFSVSMNVSDYVGHRLAFKCQAEDRVGNTGESSVREVVVYDRPPRVKSLRLSDATYVTDGTSYLLALDYPSDTRFRISWFARASRSEPWRSLSSTLVSSRQARGALHHLSSWIGQEVYLKVSVSDSLGNTSAFELPRPYTVYRWRIFGHLDDNRGMPLPRPHVWADPPLVGFQVGPGDVYTAYQTAPVAQWITLEFTEALSPTYMIPYFPDRAPDVRRDFYIGIGPEHVSNPSFEQGRQGWTFHRAGSIGWAGSTPPLSGSGAAFFPPDVLARFEVLQAVGLRDGRQMYLLPHAGADGARGLLQRLDGSWMFTSPLSQMRDVFQWRGAADTRSFLHTLLTVREDGMVRGYYVRWTAADYWSSPFRLFEYPRGSQISGDIDVDGRDYVHVVWGAYSPSQSVPLYYRRLTPSGEWSPRQTVTTVSLLVGAFILAGETRLWIVTVDAQDNVCVWASTDRGQSWSNEGCRHLPSARQGVWSNGRGAILAGGNTLYYYTGERLFCRHSHGWTEVSIDGLMYRNLVGCPDGTLHFIGALGSTPQGDEYIVGDIVLNRDGQRMRTERWGTSSKENVVIAQWCDERTRGALFPYGGFHSISMRVDQAFHRVPLLSQRVQLPVRSPTLGFYVRGASTDLGMVEGILEPDSGPPIHVSASLQPEWSYLSLPADVLAGQSVTLTIALSSTLAGFPLTVAVDDVSIRSTPEDVGVWGAIQSTSPTASSLPIRLTLRNARPVSVPTATVEITWTQSYTLSAWSTLADEITSNSMTVTVGPLPPLGTRTVAFSLRSLHSPPEDLEVRVHLLPDPYDVNRRNDVWFGRRLWSADFRQYVPYVFARSP